MGEQERAGGMTPLNDYVTHDEYAGREKLCDERFARDKARIEGCENLVREIQMLNEKMSQMIERHDKQIEDQDRRIKNLELQPADTFDKIRIALTTAVVTGIAGWIVSAIANAPK